MSFLTYATLLSLLALWSAASPSPDSRPSRTCRHVTTFAHHAVQMPFSPPIPVRVPIHFRFGCAPARNRPLLLLMQGAFLRPAEYDTLADGLARRGFVVAIPDYTQRNNPRILRGDAFFEAHLKSTRSFKCPKKGQLATTALAASALDFLQSRRLRSDIRRSYNVKRTVLFVHSLGGAVSQFLFNDLCDKVKKPMRPPPAIPVQHPDFFQRYSCEQPRQIPTSVKVLGIVSFEGHNANTGKFFPRNIPYVAINSRFYVEKSNSYFGGNSYGGRLAVVRIGKANHFGPVDFVTQNNNQKPVCAVGRAPPEASFTTTLCEQNTVIRTIARITLASYRSFQSPSNWKPLKGLVVKEKILVQQVKIQ